MACGGLAASEVGERVREAEQRVGGAVPVVVAARDLGPGTELSRGDLTVRQVPHRFAPRDAPAAPQQAIGLSTAGPVAAGSPITAGVVGGEEGAGAAGALRRGERALEVAVTAAAALMDAAAPGARVDVLVSTDASTATGLGAEADSTAPAATAFATLRVTLGQAVYLTAAETFAHELRLLPRPPGDKRRLGRATVDAGSL